MPRVVNCHLSFLGDDRSVDWSPLVVGGLGEVTEVREYPDGRICFLKNFLRVNLNLKYIVGQSNHIVFITYEYDFNTLQTPYE